MSSTRAAVIMLAILGVCLLLVAHTDARFLQFDDADRFIPERAVRFNGLRFGLGYVKSVQSARAKPHDGFSPLLLSVTNMDGPFGNSNARQLDQQATVADHE
uniref:Uncharacterized protein n=1 Tax=Plectus sambesii TaxID=2011161 RepID=A0A914X9T8_9BILA